MVSSSSGKGRLLPRSLRPGEAPGTQNSRFVAGAPQTARKKRPPTPVGMTGKSKQTQEREPLRLRSGQAGMAVPQGGLLQSYHLE